MRSRAEALLWLAPLGLALAPAWAQESEATAPKGSRVQLQLGASLLLSDQMARSQTLSPDKGGLLILSPGLLWRSNRGAVQGSFDYSLNAIKKFQTEASLRPLQHQLRANVRTSLVPELLSVDLVSQVGQQALSVFGPQSAGTQPTSSVNRAEVGSLSLTPQMRVRLAGAAQLQLRHTQTVQRARGTAQGDSDGRSSAVSLSPLQERVLAWSAEYSEQHSRARLGRSTQTELALAGLKWRPDVDWRLAARAGWERSDVLNGVARSGEAYGGSISWQPSARTSLALNWDQRLVADQYSLNLNHRLPRSLLGLTLSRSLNLPGSYLLGEAQTRYEQLFALYASREPDAQRRDQLVREELTRLGLSLDATVTPGFLSSNPSLSHGLQLSWAWSLPRALFSLGLSQRRTERLGQAQAGVADDLLLSATVRQQGANLAWTYRLEPRQSLTLQGIWQRNQGERDSLDSTLTSVNLIWVLRLSRYTQFSAGYRHSSFEATQRPYDENALMLTLTQQF